TLEGTELDACPGLKAALASIDANNDKKISADELKTRFELYEKLGAGAIGYSIQVSLDGFPLSDATIRLTPESFMGGAVSEATGRTGSDGSVSTFTIGGSDLPGLPAGVYRIAVSKEGTAIPAKYNAQTTLGCEVFGGPRGGAPRLDIKLNSR